MQLAIFIDQVFWQERDLISTDEPFALFIASFAEICDELILIGRASPEPGRAPHALDHPAIKLLPLPYYPSLYELWRSNPRIYSKITSAARRAAPRWDALILCGPHPLGQLIARECSRANVPVALVVRQDLVAQMAAHSGLKRLTAVAAARLLDWDFKKLARGRTVFTVGDKLTGDYRMVTHRVHPHMPCLVDEVQFRDLSAMQAGRDPMRLICVGRLAPEKGQDYLLQALSILKSGGMGTHLDVVGTGPFEQRLKDTAVALRIVTEVTFHGYVPYGSRLFELYQQAGIFVLPSLSEGLPQVITEALSAGLPIVATSVGGIPTFLTEGCTGLLVPPRDPIRLAASIARLIGDAELRDVLIRNGRDLMRDNTLEATRARMMGVIRSELLTASR